MNQQKHMIDNFFDIEQEFDRISFNSIIDQPLYFQDNDEFQNHSFIIDPKNYQKINFLSKNGSTALDNLNEIQSVKQNDFLNLSFINNRVSSINEIKQQIEDIQSNNPHKFGLKSDTDLTRTQNQESSVQNIKTKLIEKKGIKQKNLKKTERKDRRNKDKDYEPRITYLSSHRRGKHSQSKTQKFIYLMTRYHYSKNFFQYLKKRMIQKVGSYQQYQKFGTSQKINAIDLIIAQLSQYKMAVHYSVEQSQLFNSFTDVQKNLIRMLFHKIIQKTYQIRLKLLKVQIQHDKTHGKSNKHNFFDKKGEQIFNRLFDEFLKEGPFYPILTNCGFLQKIHEIFNGKQLF